MDKTALLSNARCSQIGSFPSVYHVRQFNVPPKSERAPSSSHDALLSGSSEKYAVAVTPENALSATSGLAPWNAIEFNKIQPENTYSPIVVTLAGKTTLANIIAQKTSAHFSSLNAVLSGIADLKKEIDDAIMRYKLYEERTVLFVDEIHR